MSRDRTGRLAADFSLLNLYQINSVVTAYESLLDLVFSNASRVFALAIEELLPMDNYHLPLDVVLNTYNKNDVITVLERSFDYLRADYESFHYFWQYFRGKTCRLTSQSILQRLSLLRRSSPLLTDSYHGDPTFYRRTPRGCRPSLDAVSDSKKSRTLDSRRPTMSRPTKLSRTYYALRVDSSPTFAIEYMPIPRKLRCMIILNRLGILLTRGVSVSRCRTL